MSFSPPRPTLTTPIARAGIAVDPDWRVALRRALGGLAGLRPDALLLFAGHGHAAAFPELLATAARTTGARTVIGCASSSVIGMERELEGEPAVAALGLALPGAELATARIDPRLLATDPDGGEWPARLGIPADRVNGWLLFADPLRLDGDAVLAALGNAYPNAPVCGGFAGVDPNGHAAALFLDGEVVTDGAVGLAIGGDYGLLPVVSQGCEPLGEPWMVTGVQSSWIETISNRPALQVMTEALDALPDDLRERAGRNLLVGFATDEYRHEFLRGDFLVRNLIGADQATGAIAVGTVPALGQTVQFQLRDAATADLDLTLTLEQARHELGERTPIAGLLCAGEERGQGLFGSPHHDAAAITRKFAGLPLGGFAAAGTFGPVGAANHVHAAAASLALVIRTG